MDAKIEENITTATNTTADDTNSLNTSTSSIDINNNEPTEEEFKMAEEFKSKGNEAFKSKILLYLIFDYIDNISLQMVNLNKLQNFTLRLFSAKQGKNKRLFTIAIVLQLI